MLPEFGLSLMHDDNIYAQPSGETSDLVTTTSLSVDLKSQWDRHSLNLDAGLDADRYADHSRENVTDYWLGASGAIDLSKQFELFGGVRYEFDHEDRAEADALSPSVAAEPTRYDQVESHLGVAYNGERISVRLGGTFTRMNFRDVDSVLGPTINMDDRDRDMSSIGARVGLRVQPGLTVFAQYATDNRHYRSRVDDAGYARDSDGYRAAMGVGWTGLPGLRAEAFAGVMRQEFDETRFGTVSQPYFGLDVSWRPRPGVLMSGYIDRNLEESTIPGVSAYLDTTYGLRAERQITSRLSLAAHMAYTDSQFQGTGRTDRVIDAGVSARYYLTRNLYLTGAYRLIDRDSDEDEANYVRSQFLIGLGLVPGASRPDTTTADDLADYGTAPRGFAGFHVGAALGAGTLNSITNGVRDSGTDVGSMADWGWSGSLYLGLGFFPVQRWYIGLEGEADVANVDWYHSKAKDDARTSTMARTDAYGAALRLGRLLDNGALFYIRGGVVRAHFDTTYAQNDPAVADSGYDRSDAVDGWRAGVGVDVPLGSRAFLRLDYSYTDYQTLEVPYLTTSGLAVEAIDSREGVFHLGLGMRLGGSAPTPDRPAAAVKSGLYAGLQGGHIMPTSRVEGLQRDGSPTTYSFVGDFGGDGGTLGVFAGYGRVFHRFYAGVELEADTVKAKWRHERETTGGGGRDFSVDQRFAYGASLRAGYVVGDTLLYVRGGPVFGRFRTQWNKGNNASAYVDRTDHLVGARIGLGAEIQLRRGAFLRMEFTHTRYERYDFVTTHGGGANADAMKFDNAESLFRIGFGLRF